MQFADVSNDIALWKIFGNENRKECLISFLNAILDFQGDRKIVSVNIIDPYQLPYLRGGMVFTLDVEATDQANRNYIIEIQIAELDGFGKRVLYYSSKSYSSQITRAEFYQQLNPVIFIGILEFGFTQNPHYLNRSQVRHVETGERTLHDIEFNFIELPKFNKQLHELETLIDKWIFFIKNAENLDVMPENINDEGLKSAYEEANKFSWTQNELEVYDYVSMREGDAKARTDFATKKALHEGKLEIAQNGILKGYNNEVITDLTGLSMEEIEMLRDDLKK